MTAVDARIIDVMRAPDIRDQVATLVETVVVRLARQRRRPMPPTITGEILNIVAARFGTTPAKLQDHGRHRSIARPRFVAYWLLRRRGLSFPEVGDAIGGRDHSTVIHGVRFVDANPELLAIAEALAKEMTR